jgi:hypothetical protein
MLNAVVTKCRQASTEYYSIFVILMYLCKSFSPIKIVSHENVILMSESLEYPKIVNCSSNGRFYNGRQPHFQQLSVSHTLSLSLSLSLSVSPAANPFPLLSDRV